MTYSVNYGTSNNEIYKDYNIKRAVGEEHCMVQSLQWLGFVGLILILSSGFFQWLGFVGLILILSSGFFQWLGFVG